MDYRIALLHRLGFPVTKENLRFLSTWQAHEGGHTKNAARFNWWNSTRGDQYPLMPGSNRVRSYPNFATGVRYTAETLNNGRYPDIMAGLKAGNPYKAPIADDLSVWVSGTPNLGLRYAKSILGPSYREPKKSRQLAASAASGQVAAAPVTQIGQQGGDLKRQALMSYFMASNAALVAGQTQPSFIPFAQAIQAAAGTPQGSVTPSKSEKTAIRAFPSGKSSSGFLQAPTSWKGTHPTDNLGWGTRSAEDIMSSPGTPVGAPEDGVVVRHGSAQGGESLYFRSDSGQEYWLGHVESDIPAGTRVRRGQVIATISSRHPRPHLHIDKRRIKV